MAPSSPTRRRAVHVLVGIALAACGEDRVLIEVGGPNADVVQLDVWFVAPVVYERIQRTNLDAGVEQVYYAAPRGSATIRLLPGERWPLTLELDASRAGGAEPYLPVVVARNAQQAIVGIAALAPGELFPTSPTAEHRTAVAEPRSDVTIYAVELEPVTEVEHARDRAVPVPVDHAMVVRCGEAPSGLVWRRANGQLRLVLPLDGRAATARLERRVDLDCDDSSPGVDGQARIDDEGDRRDCDDTAEVRYPGAAEACDGVDNDCDGEAGPPIAVSRDCPLVGARCSAVRVCDDARPLPEGSCQPENLPCRSCRPRLDPDFAALTKSACVSAAELRVPGCGANCRVTIVDADPRWTIEIGPSGDPTRRFGVGEPYTRELDTEPLALYARSSETWPLTQNLGGTFALYVQPRSAGGVVVPYALELDNLLGPTLTCDPVELATCN